MRPARSTASSRAGGSLVAGGDPRSEDVDAGPREAPALASLGIEAVRGVRESVRGAYFDLGDHRGFPSLADTSLVFVDGPYVDVTYAPDAAPRLRLIPPGPFGPPERCVLPAPGDEPGLVIHPFGEGTAVFVPWRCGSLYERLGNPNTSSFAADVLRHHAGVEPLGGTLSPMVEVTLFERDAGAAHLLHLVNASGHHGTSCFEPVTMHDAEVVIPYEGTPRAVTALVAGAEPAWSVADGRLTITVPELRLFEAIEITRNPR